MWAWSFSWARKLMARDIEEQDKPLEQLDQVHLAPGWQDSLV